ncbi:hypothetical protein ACHAXS_005021 [Conticribra weissflogii]
MASFPAMPLLSITSPETIVACKSLPLRPSDIFICSYPKSGTTWTQHIVLSLILADRRCRLQKEHYYKKGTSNHKTIEFDIHYDHVSDFAPFFEIDAHWDLKNKCLAEPVTTNHDRLGRRVFNTHLRWEMLPKYSEEKRGNHKEHDSSTGALRPSCGKFIYVTRNVLDVCASFYHHLSNQKEGTYIESFPNFFRDWMAGKIPFGSPLHHLLSFAQGFNDNHYSGKDFGDVDHPLMLLSYQDMKINLREQVLRIIDFLGLCIPLDVVDNELLPTFGFQSMKENSHRFQPKSVTWLNGFQFLRNGEIGDGKKLTLAVEDKDLENYEKSLHDKYQEWLENEKYRELVKKILRDVKDDYVCNIFNDVVGV